MSRGAGDGGVSDDHIGGGSTKDAEDVALLEALRHRYAMDYKIKQVSFVNEKILSELDVYLEHLRAKLTTSILHLLD